MVAQCVNMVVGDLVVNTGDTHLYANHIELAREIVSRDVRPAPTLKINPDKKDIFSFTEDDFELIGYDPHPALRGEPAI